MSEQRGRCLCGAVRFVFEGPVVWSCHCHCESCRRNTSSPFTTVFGTPKAGFRWTGEAPRVFASSPGVRRLFCGTCGTPMAYESDSYPEEANLYVASLEDPSAVEPSFHVHAAEKLPWIEITDGLPQYPHAYEEEGSG